MSKYRILILVIFLLTTIDYCFSQSLADNLLGENIITTNLNERDFTLTPDGQTAFFTRSHFDNKTRFIVQVQKRGNKWVNPEIASFSGRFNDLEPFLAPDGKRLFFASNRNSEQTDEKRDYDIWYVDLQSDGKFGGAKRLGDHINTGQDEFYPAVGSSGNLYFTAVRESGIGSEDIFMSELVNGEYQLPSVLSEKVNSKTYEFNAYISPNEDLIIYSSYGRPDGFGGGDLYYSVKDENGSWMESKHLGIEINSTALDYSPFYDVKNQLLYYTSNRKKNIKKSDSHQYDLQDLENMSLGIFNGYGNIYSVKIKLK